MYRAKRIIGLSLVITVMLSWLTACGNKNKKVDLEYQQATLTEPLEYPDGASVLEASNLAIIPNVKGEVSNDAYTIGELAKPPSLLGELLPGTDKKSALESLRRQEKAKTKKSDSNDKKVTEKE